MKFSELAKTYDRIGAAKNDPARVSLLARLFAIEPIENRFFSARDQAGVVRKGPTFLYVEVDNLEQTINAVMGAELVMPTRKTFYGSTEIGVKDPSGHYVTFAEFAQQGQK